LPDVFGEFSPELEALCSLAGYSADHPEDPFPEITNDAPVFAADSLGHPLLPPERPKPKGGRPPVPDRKALTGIIFVLNTGIQWEDLPQEMGCGCGMTCWRRLGDGHRAGVWDEVHAVLLDRALRRSSERLVVGREEERRRLRVSAQPSQHGVDRRLDEMTGFRVPPQLFGAPGP